MSADSRVGRAPLPPKPALLKGGMIICWLYAATLVLLLLMLPMLDDLSVTAGGSAGLPGSAALQSEFLSQIKSTSQLFIIPLLVLSIFVAYGLAKDRYWSRAMMMTLLILGVVLTPPAMATTAVYVTSTAVAIFGWWYLYRKPNVVEYYSALRRERPTASEASQ